MRPLEDVRIIAIEQYGAGPFGSLHLADLGAEVIKIEDPATGGDVGRHVPPHTNGEDSLFFQTFNRNKYSIALDIRTEAGRTVFDDLVRSSDAVYSNLRGDVPAKLGIQYEDLAHLNPAIVCCSLSGYGTTGPRAAQPAYDYILQGLTGWMALTGEPGGPPTKTGLSLIDFSGGLVAAVALVTGIHAARRDGTGMDCDVSLFDTAISMLSYIATWQLNTDYTAERTHNSAHPSLVPFQNFQTSDGWIVVGCAKEKFWSRLTNAIAEPALATDPRFATFAQRQDNAAELLPILNKVFKQRTGREWLGTLHAAGVPSGPVNDVAAALQDDQVAARGSIAHVAHPTWTDVRQPASPVRVGHPRAHHRAAPRLNEDLAHITQGVLGYDNTTVTQLRNAGAFGTPGR